MAVLPQATAAKTISPVVVVVPALLMLLALLATGVRGEKELTRPGIDYSHRIPAYTILPRAE
jgi:hypothetical protein